VRRSITLRRSIFCLPHVESACRPIAPGRRYRNETVKRSLPLFANHHRHGVWIPAFRGNDVEGGAIRPRSARAGSSQNRRASSRADSVAKRRSRINSGSAGPAGRSRNASARARPSGAAIWRPGIVRTRSRTSPKPGALFLLAFRRGRRRGCRRARRRR
jgi:hypothetical protein